MGAANRLNLLLKAKEYQDDCKQFWDRYGDLMMSDDADDHAKLADVRLYPKPKAHCQLHRPPSSYTPRDPWDPSRPSFPCPWRVPAGEAIYSTHRFTPANRHPVPQEPRGMCVPRPW